MLTLTAAWRERILEWVPESAIPSHPELGRRYPWRTVAAHAFTREHRRRVDQARRILDQALASGRWYASFSGGKDSTALVVLLEGRLPLVSVRDDLDFPGDEDYVRGAAGSAPLAILSPRGSKAEHLAAVRARLLEPDAIAPPWDWFMGLLRRHQEAEAYDGVVLGLRAGESAGRRWNRRVRGTTYTRADGLRVCTPAADWHAIDSHAVCLATDVPLAPVYLCVDPGQDPMSIRQDGWAASGWSAQLGHYAWLRRWWPELWEIAVSIDPAVAEVS